MEKSLNSAFGWANRNNKEAGTGTKLFFRNVINSIRKFSEDMAEQETQDDQNLCVNVCGCTVSMFALQDCSLII